MGFLLKTGSFRRIGRAQKEGQDFVLKVQPFAKGGYEATVRAVDLEKIGNAMLGVVSGASAKSRMWCRSTIR